MHQHYYPYSNIPFIRVFIPFALGIISFSYLPYDSILSPLPIVLTTFFILLLVIHFLMPNFFKIKSFFVWGILFNIFLFIGGYTLSGYNYPSFKHHQSTIKNGLAWGKIASTPMLKGKNYKIELEIYANKEDKQWITSEGKALIYIPFDKKAGKLEVGDEIIFSPHFESVSNGGNPNEFDYRQYLAYHFIAQTGYLKSNDWLKISSDKTYSPKRFAERLRNKVLLIFKELNLSKDVNAIASAITLGYKNDIEAEIKQTYATAGATHILAVSGLHVGVVYLVLQYLLFFLKNKKWQEWLKIILILLSLWAYAFITGLSPSVLRATTMFSFLAIGRQINKQTNIYNILAASAFLLLCTNPFLLFDVGFQLSYIAVIGIVYFQPKIRNWVFVKNTFFSFIWDLVSVTLAAQLVTTPLSLYYFHQFPTYFILSGIVLVPITSFVIYLSLLALVFSVVPLISHVFAFGLKYLVLFMNHYTHFIEHLPFSTIPNIYINELQLFILYSLLISLTLFFMYKKIYSLKISLYLIIIFSISSLVQKIDTLSQKSIYVYNIRNCSSLNFIDGRQNILFANFQEDKKNSLQYSLKNHWLSKGLNAEKLIPFERFNSQFLFSNLSIVDNPNLFFKRHFFNYYGYKILVIYDDFFFKKQFDQSVQVDAIILQQRAKVNLRKLISFVRTKNIIIDSSVPNKKAQKWLSEAKELKLSIYHCKKQGAWKAEI